MMSLSNRTLFVGSGLPSARCRWLRAGRRIWWLAAWAVVLLVPLSARPGPGRQAVAPAATIALAPCEIPGVKDKARCGTYQVWENRQAKSGRRIGLKVVVLPATGATREKDALTFLAGGPGDAATLSAPFVAALFSGLRQRRDTLFVDQRGTGGSHPLECDLYPGDHPQTALGAFYPVDRVRTCRAELEKGADLRQYTTANGVDDLNEVRAALGYDRLNLFGGSYGTRAALVFIRRHPKSVRTAVLQGVAPPDEPMPLNFPRYAQRAIERVFADCAADAACHAAFPDPAGELAAIVKRTAANPAPADVLDPKTGEMVHVSLSRNLLGEALRYLMYESATALLVPDLVHQAENGDFAPLAEFALGSRRQVVNGLGQGLYLSVTCAEDLPFITPAEAERAAANTFLGDYRYQQQQAACDAWVRAPVAADFQEPVRADTPVLMFSGTWDPATPASSAERAAKTLPRSLSVVIPAGGHDYQGLQGAEQCQAALIQRFVEQGSAAGLDTSCASRLRRPPFPTSPLQTKPLSLTLQDMAPFVGRYAAQGAPPLEIQIADGKLRARVQGQGDLVLVPVSPTRLRVLGAIGSYLDCQTQGGRVSRITLEQAGTKVVSWTKSQ